MKVELAVVRRVSVDVKTKLLELELGPLRAQALCESQSRWPS